MRAVVSLWLWHYRGMTGITIVVAWQKIWLWNDCVCDWGITVSVAWQEVWLMCYCGCGMTRGMTGIYLDLAWQARLLWKDCWCSMTRGVTEALLWLWHNQRHGYHDCGCGITKGMAIMTVAVAWPEIWLGHACYRLTGVGFSPGPNRVFFADTRNYDVSYIN